jgi:hypothetical protein
MVEEMRRRLTIGTYLAWFGAGLVFDLAVWAVCHVLGTSSLSSPIEWTVGLIAAAFGFSLLTGVNLGLPDAIRNVGGDAGSLVSPRGGLRLLLFSVAVLFVGPAFSVLLK